MLVIYLYNVHTKQDEKHLANRVEIREPASVYNLHRDDVVEVLLYKNTFGRDDSAEIVTTPSYMKIHVNP